MARPAWRPPMAWVVLLKGVNVGGKTFRPSQMAEELADLGLTSIGAAGTFVASGAVGPAQIRSRIAGWLPFEAATFVIPGAEVVELVRSDPLAKDAPSVACRRFVCTSAAPIPSRP